MSQADFYNAICMDNDVLPGLDIPSDRRKRFQWFKDIGLSCRYSYTLGTNFCGNLISQPAKTVFFGGNLISQIADFVKFRGFGQTPRNFVPLK